MTEDELYRSSTQYRVWSYTPESLQSLRVTTNQSAAERVVNAFRRHRQANGTSNNDTQNTNGQETEIGSTGDAGDQVDCLNDEEELTLLEYYCEQCLKIGDSMKFPTNVKATAIQYLKRFYLSNSLMTYHPRDMVPTALFLATKTENSYMSLSHFASNYPKKTAEQIIAPEFILTQGLRFTFDVRHPHRGLRGGLIELLAMANGDAAVLPNAHRTPKEHQTAMLALPPIPGAKAPTSPKALAARCGAAHDRAKELLASAALLTDAYFLFTPSQLWLAALLLSDEPLTLFYLATKFPGSTADALDNEEPEADDVETEVEVTAAHVRTLHAVRACAALLTTHAARPRETRDALVRIDKKLYACQNPEKRDLVGLARARKRGEDGVVGEEEGHVAKKRRLERERGEREGDVFGGMLSAG